ncbi:hypothetical protein RDWZM_003442 [Blomia tropicalis]|uniref:Uncharacterized protein n=1 Tax=Blomia tropicalis TaxID=40697 RepID=A0A9Q0MI93_BLOTA|nr:hypothetical protein RDWZM_003442 [Blomia tropicalis]
MHIHTNWHQLVRFRLVDELIDSWRSSVPCSVQCTSLNGDDVDDDDCGKPRQHVNQKLFTRHMQMKTDWFDSLHFSFLSFDTIHTTYTTTLAIIICTFAPMVTWTFLNEDVCKSGFKSDPHD